jgi:sporulation protein YlmC with PRC-barrel domain
MNARFPAPIGGGGNGATAPGVPFLRLTAMADAVVKRLEGTWRNRNMRTSSIRVAAFALTAAAFTLPAFAQTNPPSPSGTPPAATSPSGTSGVTATPKMTPPPRVQNRDKTQAQDNAAMTNSTAMSSDVGMTGKRASKIIGMDVVNDKDQTIGKVDDILIGPDNKATAAVISVGGFLGIGSKWVAVPFEQLQPAANDSKSLTIPNASKEQLKAMPEFKYGNGA